MKYFFIIFIFCSVAAGFPTAKQMQKRQQQLEYNQVLALVKRAVDNNEIYAEVFFNQKALCYLQNLGYTIANKDFNIYVYWNSEYVNKKDILNACR